MIIYCKKRSIREKQIKETDKNLRHSYNSAFFIKILFITALFLLLTPKAAFAKETGDELLSSLRELKNCTVTGPLATYTMRDSSGKNILCFYPYTISYNGNVTGLKMKDQIFFLDESGRLVKDVTVLQKLLLTEAIGKFRNGKSFDNLNADMEALWKRYVNQMSKDTGKGGLGTYTSGVLSSLSGNPDATSKLMTCYLTFINDHLVRNLQAGSGTISMEENCKYIALTFLAELEEKLENLKQTRNEGINDYETAMQWMCDYKFISENTEDFTDYMYETFGYTRDFVQDVGKMFQWCGSKLSGFFQNQVKKLKYIELTGYAWFSAFGISGAEESFNAEVEEWVNDDLKSHLNTLTGGMIGENGFLTIMNNITNNHLETINATLYPQEQILKEVFEPLNELELLKQEMTTYSENSLYSMYLLSFSANEINGKDVRSKSLKANEAVGKIENLCETFLFETDASGCLISYRGTERAVVIPDFVTAIGTGAFEGNTAIVTVSLGKNVTTIGPGAFKNCTSLTGITYGTKLETIGDNAFLGCAALKNGNELPGSVKRVGAYAFSGTNFTKLIFGAGLTELGQKVCDTVCVLVFKGTQAAICQDQSNLVSLKAVFVQDSAKAVFTSLNQNKLPEGTVITSVSEKSFYNDQYIVAD